MAKKDNATLWILGAVAVAGYFAFRSGGFLNKPQSSFAAPQPGTPVPQFSNPRDIGIAAELPNAPDIGIYIPYLDPTGQTIQFF